MEQSHIRYFSRLCPANLKRPLSFYSMFKKFQPQFTKSVLSQKMRFPIMMGPKHGIP